jgi:DNA-binding response OmpR family regulator
MMPGVDGYQICREIRREDLTTPIIFISAKSEEVDRVVGLELGADDFILKPFGVSEVLARIRAVTRRCYNQGRREQRPEDFRMADLDILPAELRAKRGEQTIDLSLRDIKILTLLYRSGRVGCKPFSEKHPSPSPSRTLDPYLQLRKQVRLDPRTPNRLHGPRRRLPL